PNLATVLHKPEVIITIIFSFQNLLIHHFILLSLFNILIILPDIKFVKFSLFYNIIAYDGFPKN
ncbi:MAG: hypothetical protein SOH67_03030, partial [Leuconostoc gelidum]